ncbi:MAG: hypothetical protein N2B58_06445 [Desulfobacterales bacterium]
MYSGYVEPLQPEGLFLLVHYDPIGYWVDTPNNLADPISQSGMAGFFVA